MSSRASAPRPSSAPLETFAPEGGRAPEDAVPPVVPPRTTAPMHPSGLVDRLTWRLAIANLVAQIGIIATGGAVRLTGSGLGCSTWPMCEPGQFTPVLHEDMSFHPLIEFGNRTMTGVLTVIAVALLWALYRRNPVAQRDPGVRLPAWIVLAGIAVQAVVGGVSVHIELHPLLVGVHMVASLGLVAASTYLLLRLVTPDGQSRPVLDGGLRWVPWVLAALMTVVVYLGTFVTGTGPLSGDASEIVRLGFDHALITRAHSLTVWVFVAISVLLYVVVRREPRSKGTGDLAPLRQALVGLLIACAITGVIGYTQYITGLPALMVGLHMIGSGLVVAATTWVCTRSYLRA